MVVIYKKQIEEFKCSNEQEKNDKKIILEAINKSGEKILTRESELAHITSSGFIMNRELTKILMIHHKIYDTWAWTGGHADGDRDLMEIALKEANEETGLKEFTVLTGEIDSIDILNVDGHIKNNEYISTHLHLNVAYILIADENEELIVNHNETNGIKWIDIEMVAKRSGEPKIVRIYNKLINKAKKYYENIN